MLHAHYPLWDSDPADWLTFSPGMLGRKAVNAVISGILAHKARATLPASESDRRGQSLRPGDAREVRC